MSFLPAVQREINNRPLNDPVRVTLEYFMQRGVGRQNSVTLANIVRHLQRQRLNITETGFQQSVLAESRARDFYIGSGPRGYYLIDTIADAREMRDFYVARMRAERRNLRNLRREAAGLGWGI